MQEHIIEKRYSDGSFGKYNLTQRYKAYQAKKLNHNASIVEIDHPIIGQQFMHQNKLVTFDTVPSTTQVPCHVAPRKGLESGWVQNLKDFEAVFQSDGHQITTIDEYLGILNSHLKEPVSEHKPNTYSKMVQYYRRSDASLQQS